MDDFKADSIQFLIIELKKGSEKAFRVIYERYQKKLYHYTLQFVKSTDISEELLQEVFIKIWLKRKELNEKKDFTSFLFVITRNIIYDHLRKTATRNLLIKTYFEFKELISNRTSDDIQSREYEILLNHIIKELPEQKQKIYILSRKEGKSNQEIADVLGISPKTVKNNLWEVLKIIKIQLQPYMEFKIPLIIFLIKILEVSI